MHDNMTRTIRRSKCAGYDPVGIDIHLEAILVQGWRPRLCDLGSHHYRSLEIHLKAETVRTLRWARRPWPCQIGVDRESCQSGGEQSQTGQSGGHRLGGWYNGISDYTYWFFNNSRNVESEVQQLEQRDERYGIRYLLVAEDSESCVDVVHSEFSTPCMLYSLNAVCSENSWLWHGEIEGDDLILFS